MRRRRVLRCFIPNEVSKNNFTNRAVLCRSIINRLNSNVLNSQSEKSLVEGTGEECIQQVLVDQRKSQHSPAEPEPKQRECSIKL